ncbi:10328_t:CDS:2, partial [Racocetra persica]
GPYDGPLGSLVKFQRAKHYRWSPKKEHLVTSASAPRYLVGSASASEYLVTSIFASAPARDSLEK